MYICDSYENTLQWNRSDSGRCSSVPPVPTDSKGIYSFLLTMHCHTTLSPKTTPPHAHTHTHTNIQTHTFTQTHTQFLLQALYIIAVRFIANLLLLFLFPCFLMSELRLTSAFLRFIGHHVELGEEGRLIKRIEK